MLLRRALLDALRQSKCLLHLILARFELRTIESCYTAFEWGTRPRLGLTKCRDDVSKAPCSLCVRDQYILHAAERDSDVQP